MSKKIFRFIAYTNFIFLSFILHIFIKTVLPFPFDYLNIMILIFVWINIFRPDSILFKAMIIPLMCLELFTYTPFGLMTGTILITCFIIRWFVRNVFTNYSFYMVVSITLLSLICYRLIWYGAMTILSIFTTTLSSVTREVVKDWSYEILVTASTIIILYIIVAWITPYFKPHYIKKISSI